jgi:asparagine synthase (glutamine-hydrolysing)
MSRWLVGAYDPRGHVDRSRLSGALPSSQTTTAVLGAVAVAYSGPTTSTATPVCLLDGFLDNLDELRAELGGEVERSSPEDLIAAGYRRWGSGLPTRLRGDFALLIWDQNREEGLLARDQLGVRSLFLHETSGCLYFASEIRDLLRLLPRRPAPDALGVAHWVSTIGRPGTGTLYEGVRRLNPGSMMLLSRDGIREEEYWRLEYTASVARTEPELAGEIRGALADAVRRRLSSSGLTGVLMSGGLDSSAVAATAAALAPGAVRAYSADFPDHPAVDESQLIADLRAALALPGTTASVQSGGLLASALDWIDTWKVPLTSWGEFWCGPLLKTAASAGVTTVLGGDGGDELFGCRAYLMADRLRHGRPGEVLQLARELPGAGDHPSRRALLQEVREFAVLGALPAGLHTVLSKPSTRGQLPRWLRSSTSRALAKSLEPLAWKRLDGPRWWTHDAYVLTRGVEQVGLFENHRRRTATLGLHSRHPLFDVDLLELVIRQPPRSTFDRFRDRPMLRASMRGLVPDPIRLRPTKALFDSLLMDALTGADGSAARRLLSDPRAELAAYTDLEALKRDLLDRRPPPGSPTFHWSHQLWRLLTAECWLRIQAGSTSESIGSYASASRVALRAA